MDELADPIYCRVQEYHGPLCVSFDLKLKSHKEERRGDDNITEYHTVVDDVGESADHIELELSGGFDTGAEMEDEIIRIAFPHYSSYLEEQLMREEVTPEDEIKCKKAIQQDFDDFERSLLQEGV